MLKNLSPGLAWKFKSSLLGRCDSAPPMDWAKSLESSRATFWTSTVYWELSWAAILFSYLITQHGDYRFLLPTSPFTKPLSPAGQEDTGLLWNSPKLWTLPGYPRNLVSTSSPLQAPVTTQVCQTFSQPLTGAISWKRPLYTEARDRVTCLNTSQCDTMCFLSGIWFVRIHVAWSLRFSVLYIWPMDSRNTEAYFPGYTEASG